MRRPVAPVTDSLLKPAAKELCAPCPWRSAPRIPAGAATRAPTVARQRYRNRSTEPGPPHPEAEIRFFVRRHSFRPLTIPLAALSLQNRALLVLLEQRARPVLLALAKALPHCAIAPPDSNTDLS